MLSKPSTPLKKQTKVSSQKRRAKAYVLATSSFSLTKLIFL